MTDEQITEAPPRPAPASVAGLDGDPANLFRLNQNIRPSHTAAEPALA